MSGRTISTLLSAVAAAALFQVASVQAQTGAAISGTVSSAQEGAMEGVLVTAKKDGAHIREFVTEDGMVFRAKMFIDATYEGDLMAKAGVSYTLTREGNAKYGEQFNGIYYDPKYEPRTNHLKPGAMGRTPSGQGVWDRDFPLDPYVRRGDPQSGPSALPSDHDDDHGGSARRRPADAEPRRRIRNAPAARLHNGRRPDRQSGADFVHDPRHLYLSRSSVALDLWL